MKRVDASELTPYLDRAPLLRDLPSPVVVGCSGGADSVALLVLAVAAALDPVAVTVDHGLRVESAGEAARVAELAAVLGVGHRVVSIDVAPGANLEARARDARLSALSACAEELGAPSVLLGHTADDRAETFVLNLMRGAGRTGLAAPRELRGRFVRPLLALRRSDAEAICALIGYEPVQDPMNEDLGFKRVWVRHELLPQLAAASGRDIVPVLNRQADVFAAEDELLDRLARAAWPGDRADARELIELDMVLARRAVRIWGGTPPLTLAEVDRILDVARGLRRSAAVGGGRRVVRQHQQLHWETTEDGVGWHADVAIP